MYRPTPTITLAASAEFSIVADIPHVRIEGENRRSLASANSTCVPRLLDKSSCHSSTIAHRTPAKVAAASSRVNKSVRLSGVVTNTSGSPAFCFALSDDGVSPVLASTLTLSPISRAGSCNASVMSRDTARKGDTYKILKPRGTAGLGSRLTSSIKSANAPKYAAYVFPDPVGTWISPLRPAWYASHASR
jgi:hypothetical protein